VTFFLHKVNGNLSSGQPWSTGLVSSGSISEGAANTAWAGAWSTFMGTAAVNALFRTSVTITLASTSTASSTFRQTTVTRANLALAGTAVTDELPDFCAMVLTLRSSSATKYGHGRMYLPAPVAAGLSAGTGGHMLSGTMTAMSAGLSALLTSLVTAGLSPILVSRRATLSGQPQYSTRNVVAADMPNILTVQHRRGDKIVPARTTVTL
jgi:hypothetical protein